MSASKNKTRKAVKPRPAPLPLEVVAQIAATLASNAACKERPDDELSPQVLNEILVRASRRAVALVEHCTTAIAERRTDRLRESARANEIAKEEAKIRIGTPDQEPPRLYGNKLLRFVAGVAESTDPVPRLTAILQHVSPLQRRDPYSSEQVARLEAQAGLPPATGDLACPNSKRARLQSAEAGKAQQAKVAAAVAEIIERWKDDGLTVPEAMDERDRLRREWPKIRRMQAIQNAQKGSPKKAVK